MQSTAADSPNEEGGWSTGPMDSHCCQQLPLAVYPLEFRKKSLEWCPATGTDSSWLKPGPPQQLHNSPRNTSQSDLRCSCRYRSSHRSAHIERVRNPSQAAEMVLSQQCFSRYSVKLISCKASSGKNTFAILIGMVRPGAVDLVSPYPHITADDMIA